MAVGATRDVDAKRAPKVPLLIVLVNMADDVKPRAGLRNRSEEFPAAEALARQGGNLPSIVEPES